MREVRARLGHAHLTQCAPNILAHIAAFPGVSSGADMLLCLTSIQKVWNDLAVTRAERRAVTSRNADGQHGAGAKPASYLETETVGQSLRADGSYPARGLRAWIGDCLCGVTGGMLYDFSAPGVFVSGQALNGRATAPFSASSGSEDDEEAEKVLFWPDRPRRRQVGSAQM